VPEKGRLVSFAFADHSYSAIIWIETRGELSSRRGHLQSLPNERQNDARLPLHDRTLLLHGSKRNEVLSLAEIEQYGLDSFADADYISIYGMKPRQWYGCGIRLLGRTVVECTRDALADRIGCDVASVARGMSLDHLVVIDPFAGSCNTLLWILRHLPNSEGVGFEADPQVFELTHRNLECRVGHPAKIRAAETRQQKHDRRDAEVILELLLMKDRFPDIWMPSTEQRDLRSLLRDRHQWVKMRARLQHTLQAMALNHALRFRVLKC